MFKNTHKVGAGAAAVALALGGMLVTPRTAMAVPYGCHYEMSNRDAVGTCDRGSGTFRIRLDCSNAPDRTSVWASPGQYVAVRCLAGMPYGGSFETQ
ncbi:hypothetical protein [Luteococcus sp.]|uniref:hypothetical protein n=1 Tax=Luteococcus sp. TaxID=1969402 RepID=UPI0037370E53